jgi:uncharacterized membrane protein YraQ (UPF0718 family)
MIQVFLYVLAITLTLVSLMKDKEKTKKALKKGWIAFENILPTVLSVMAVVGITLSLVNEELIGKVIGPNSGLVGILVAIAVGSITMMAGFVAFPLGAVLMERGAGVAQIAGFISALMMVGLITIPLEIKYWGRKATLMRNILGIVISFIVAIVIGLVCR